MQTFLSCAVPPSSAKKSCFIWLREVWPLPFRCVALRVLSCWNLYQRNHHAKCQYLKSSCFVAVEKREKSEELLNLLTHILSLQRVSFIIRRNQSNLSVVDRDLSFPRLQLTRRECSRAFQSWIGIFRSRDRGWQGGVPTVQNLVDRDLSFPRPHICILSENCVLEQSGP